MPEIDLEAQLQKMRADWDQRARENARHYVDTANADWTDDEFFASGEATLSEEILTDLGNICQGKAPDEMRVLEIGCGAGRVTRALARFFGEVHAVDVSGEMVRLAKQAVKEHPKAFVYQNNGKDLTAVPDIPLTLRFPRSFFSIFPAGKSSKITSRKCIACCVQERFSNSRCKGRTIWIPHKPDDTWLGAPFSERQAVDMAFRCGSTRAIATGPANSISGCGFLGAEGTTDAAILVWLWGFKSGFLRFGLERGSRRPCGLPSISTFFVETSCRSWGSCFFFPGVGCSAFRFPTCSKAAIMISSLRFSSCNSRRALLTSIATVRILELILLIKVRSGVFIIERFRIGNPAFFLLGDRADFDVAEPDLITVILQ